MWPADQDASFANLRAVGAFVVSSSLQGGVVQPTSVVSEAGLDCVFASPWQDSAKGLGGGEQVRTFYLLPFRPFLSNGVETDFVYLIATVPGRHSGDLTA